MVSGEGLAMECPAGHLPSQIVLAAQLGAAALASKEKFLGCKIQMMEVSKIVTVSSTCVTL